MQRPENFQPFAMVLGRLVKTDFITSGYVARAVK